MLSLVGGVETVRGIGYQQAQAVLVALEVLDDQSLAALRVEGLHDVVDIETFTNTGAVACSRQIKTRVDPYAWAEAELLAVLRRWAELPEADTASFEFVTNGRLGPTGETVERALRAAGDGRLGDLAVIVGGEQSNPDLRRLARASVRIDVAGVGALLLRAERQVAAMLPSPRSSADAQEQARLGVGDLFRLLFERAGSSDPLSRILQRDEIAATLGVPPNQTPAQRWPDGVRDRYLHTLLSATTDRVVHPLIDTQETVPVRIRRGAAGDGGEQFDVHTVLAQHGPIVLAGRTGTGKSTASRAMRTEAAAADQVVVLAHAETYLAGRLAALVADALSDQLGEDLPSATGRQALADRDVTLIIDGVSEVPASTQAALRDELLASVAGNRGARILLVGRDIAMLRATLPSSIAPASFVMAEFDGERRYRLAENVLRQTYLGGDQYLEAAIRSIVAKVEAALGDGSGNPLLFTMATALIADGVPFTSRANLYETFVENLAQRSGSTGIVLASAALGIVFARLLDEGRRYADPYEWNIAIVDATAELERRGSPAKPTDIDETARRSGLITPIGYTQTVAPIHDSFADYLAGVAHARGLVPLPSQLAPGDEQRVSFAAEVAGVDQSLAALIARDLPFLTVRVAPFDSRPLDDSAPADIEELTHYLLPDIGRFRTALWRIDDGRTVAIQNSEVSAWIQEAAARQLMNIYPSVVVTTGGSLAVAVRLWQQELVRRLSSPNVLGGRRPGTLEEACIVLEAHSVATAAATKNLIDSIAPPGHALGLAARVGPLGLAATVHPRAHGPTGGYFPVDYHHTADVKTKVGVRASEATDLIEGSSSVEAIIDTSPVATAAERVRKALNLMTLQHWV